jgi:hypothetical protein
MLRSTCKYKIEDDGRSFEQMGRKILWLKNREQCYVYVFLKHGLCLLRE